MTLSGGNLTVDGKKNGGISVKGENRSDILVRACVQTWSNTEAEANNLAKSIRIETAGTVRAEGADDEKNWSVSYQILVPRNTNLKLNAHNGGISISDVEGTLEFETKNGGLHLSNLAGDVRGRTANGGVHVELSGNTLARQRSRCRNNQRRRASFNERKLCRPHRNRHSQRRFQKRYSRTRG